MSPAPVNPLVQVSKVLQPNATVPLPEKVAVLQTFATTLQGKKKEPQIEERKILT